jgi:hypothetical protein
MLLVLENDLVRLRKLNFIYVQLLNNFSNFFD